MNIAETPSDAQDASGALERVEVPLKPGESVCARCGRVWRPTPNDPRFGIGFVQGVLAAFCLPCVREVEREAEEVFFE
jgi:hypothetical protein